MPTTFLDSNFVRYQLIKETPQTDLNWLFLPGGPGADSSYLLSLITLLDLPGKVWLIDLPGVGSNTGIPPNYDFDQWLEIFPITVERFSNPILVGHSFGGSFPLLFPELEEVLKGLVLLNAAPSLWLEEAVRYSKQFDLPDLTREMQEFTLNPNATTFKCALGVCMPYYFPKHTLEKGRDLLLSIPFEFLPAVWWQRKAIELSFTAQWIPQTVPTLIVGGTYDCICPFKLFQEDRRFHRPNIQQTLLKEGGHCGWIECPQEMKSIFDQYSIRLCKDRF